MAPSEESHSDPAPAVGRGRVGLAVAIIGGVLGGMVVCVLVCMGLIRGFVHSGPERSLEANIEVLKTSRSAADRGEAIRQITKKGPEAQDAVPALLDALRDDEGYVYRVMHKFYIHKQASEALAAIGGPTVGRG